MEKLASDSLMSHFLEGLSSILNCLLFEVLPIFKILILNLLDKTWPQSALQHLCKAKV